MANSYGTVRSAPILTAALAMAVAQRPLLSAIALDLNMRDRNLARAKMGQTITTRIHAIPPVEDYAKGSPTPNTQSTDVSLTLSAMKQVGSKFTAAEIQACYDESGGSDRNVILEAAAPVAQSLGDYFVDLIAGIWTHANFPQAGIAAPGTTGGVGGRYVKAANAMDFNALVDMRTICANGKIPANDRFAVMNSVAFGSLIKDPTVTARYAMQTKDTVEGTVGKIAGFSNVMEHAALASANATANMVGFFGSKDSVVFATRLPTDPSSIPGVDAKSAYSYQEIVEPRSGIRVLAIEWIDELDYNIKLVWLQGAAVGNPANGVMIISA